jgi:hypothetical protein
MAKVRVQLGMTENLGDFRSFRIDVAIEDDVRAGERVADATDRVYALVEHKLVEKLTAAMQELKG